VDDDSLKLNDTHQLLVNVYGVNILVGSVPTISTEDLVVASKEIGLDVNDDETTTNVMSRDQNAG